jgi:hypothetical protein
MSIAEKFHIATVNHLDNFTLSDDLTPESGYPLTNMQSQVSNKKTVWDTVGNTSLTIQGTQSTAYTANALFLGNHNLISDCTVRLYLYPDASYAGTPYDSTALAVDVVTSTLKNNFIRFFTAFAFKSFKVVIAMPTNNGGELWIDKLALVQAITVGIGPVYGSRFMTVDESTHRKKPGGGIDTAPYAQTRRMDLSFGAETDADMIALFNMLETARKGGDVFCSMDPNNTRGLRWRQSGIFRRASDLDATSAFYSGNEFGLTLIEN